MLSSVKRALFCTEISLYWSLQHALNVWHNPPAHRPTKFDGRAADEPSGSNLEGLDEGEIGSLSNRRLWAPTWRNLTFHQVLKRYVSELCVCLFVQSYVVLCWHFPALTALHPDQSGCHFTLPTCRLCVECLKRWTEIERLWFMCERRLSRRPRPSARPSGSHRLTP